ncbi:DUF5719 family protein [Euzebya tangerina]|uniref:DUF5719 family protein n=1 Tax=Euzebya tangerina TaxID=591198 RepID=UPI000E31C79E|nr:DUF5719 family protein [Euzebya tangerina]
MTAVRGRKRGSVLLLLAIGLAAALVLGSAVLPDPPDQVVQAETGEVQRARSGTAYCPMTASEGDTAALEIASTSADEDSQITITRFIDGVPQIDEPRVLEAGRSSTLEIPADQLSTPVTVDWLGAPVLAQYRLTDDTEQAVATCQTRPSDRWYLSGFDTNRGNTSTINLFNPFESDAIVTLRFGTTEGAVELIIADELSVPSGEVVVTDLADFRPETADLAVTVQARTGRVIPQGQIVRGPAGEGLEAITGRALIPAVPEASETLYLPEAQVDSSTDSWVTVYNPEDRAAAVQVSVTTPLATTAASVGEVTVPAGGTTRFDLADQSALPRMGVALTSVNGVRLVATRTTALMEGEAGSDAERDGVSIAAAANAADVAWTLPGARPPDGVITIFNPGAEVASARLSTAGSAPPEWDAVSIPPNAVVELPLQDAAPEGPVLVDADRPVVAAVVSVSPGSAPQLWSATGTPVRELLGPDEADQARRDPALSTRPATSATATPSAAPVIDDGGGEGQLDPLESSPTPSIVPEPTVTPTFSPGPLPTDALPTDEAPGEAGAGGDAPTGTPEPDESPPPQQPAPGEEATEEGNLFG